jgi:hypothetical protein
MKTKIAFLAILLAIPFIRMSAQSVPEERTPGLMTIGNASPPTFETRLSELEVKVWVMTQEEHKMMMEEMNSQQKSKTDNKMSMNNPKKKSTLAGTHHIKVEVTDAESGQARNDITAKAEITTPSKKNSWVDLANMSDHFGRDITLKEKGPYTFTILIEDQGVQKTTRFNYTVQ